jgi:hypothetical protein
LFTTTGDTDNRTATGAYGGLGAVFKLTQDPKSDDGRIELFYLSDLGHAAFDNIQFLTKNQLVAVQDAGDTLHTQLGQLDSSYAFDVTYDYGQASANAPVRMFAEGRDPSATLDSQFSGQTGFQNDGDNEITGFHVSDGDPRKAASSARRSHTRSTGNGASSSRSSTATT